MLLLINVYPSHICTSLQLFYAFCMALGITPMDGTTNEQHMREDIALMDRIRNGEQIFDNMDELSIIGDALEGNPDWYPEEEDEL